MTLRLYRWNNAAVPGAYVGRLQYVDPDDWTGWLDRHLTEVDEGTLSEKQLLKLWIESGGDPGDFEGRYGSPDEATMLQFGIVMPGVLPIAQDPE